ncbi:hypothetical protein P154DRAFT_574098 [Amniculicola lignicola CBS 123094]|uniref:Multiple myeloma tumor-associated protein 2-like N-terminal domain-containing protein n=1 Tax=Amniculicola lignicola CBS 123094 TaxID=1392246 RepID=A0A6A5WKX6_9PLEO|nr:hypothetical protein P154DRAFT_574098 [Amniculicola lignicola CBS 123094]
MDLVSTVRKEGSRGGRAEFKWDDVKADSQRENYLGHSVMAPVGRWQKGKDLSWYAKGDGEDDAKTIAEKLREEKRKVKEAEEDAMLKALGLPVPERASTNANMEPLGLKGKEGDVQRAVADVAAEDSDEERGKGVGFGKYGVKSGRSQEGGDRLEGDDFVRPERRRHRSRDQKDRKDRGGDRHRDSRRDRDRDHKRRRSRSRSRDRRDKRRDRSRSKDRRRDRDLERRRHRPPAAEEQITLSREARQT